MTGIHKHKERNACFQGDRPENHDDSTTSEHDPHFEPIINLPEVSIATLEEEEIEMIKLLV